MLLFIWGLFAAPAWMEIEDREAAEKRHNTLLAEKHQLVKELEKLQLSAPLTIEFDNISARGWYTNLFHKITEFVPRGMPIRRRLLMYEFSFGVRNNSNRTVSNVRAMLRSINMMNGYEFKRYFTPRADAGETVDIQPGAMEFFLLGHILREENELRSGDIVADMISMDKDDIDLLAEEAKAAEQYGLHLGLEDGKGVLHRQDGYILNLVIFGDDMPPAYGTFRMDLGERVIIALEPAGLPDRELNVLSPVESR